MGRGDEQAANPAVKPHLVAIANELLAEYPKRQEGAKGKLNLRDLEKGLDAVVGQVTDIDVTVGRVTRALRVGRPEYQRPQGGGEGGEGLQYDLLSKVRLIGWELECLNRELRADLEIIGEDGEEDPAEDDPVDPPGSYS